MPLLVSKIVRNTRIFYDQEHGKIHEYEYDQSIKQAALIGAAIGIFSAMSSFFEKLFTSKVSQHIQAEIRNDVSKNFIIKMDDIKEGS